MMDHVEKERLTLSVVIAVVIYVVFFLATGWLDILNPEGPPPYFGPLFVEIVPESTIDPVIIIKENPIIFPKDEPVRVQSEPVIRTQPEPQVEIKTQPIIQPEPETAFFAPETEVVIEPDTTIISPSNQNAEVLPVDERFDPGPASDEAPPMQTITAQTEQFVGEPTETVDQAADSQMASPVVETHSVGTDEAVTDPIADTGTSRFEAVAEEIPTDQFGTDRIIYGDSESATESKNEITATATNGNAEESSVISPGLLDGVNDALRNSRNGNGNGTGTGTDGNSVTINEVPVVDTPESTLDIAPIEAEDIAALGRQRKIIASPPPEIPEGLLNAGQTLLEALVEFTITSTGFVAGDVAFKQSSGITEIDVAIAKAIRQWKFEHVASDKEVRVRLKYVITAE
jgi:hypothetical protein